VETLRRGRLTAVSPLLVAALLTLPAAAETPLATARGLLARYHEDLGRIDRAREALEAARDDDVDTLVALAHVWFLTGELRAASHEDKLAAYAHGRDVARRAVDRASDHAGAHLWYAINLARWAETKGIFRALAALSTVREESEVVLRLDPDSVEGHALAGGLFLDVPAMLGGDQARAEEHFKRALALDPRRTGVRVELARLYLARRRPAEARRELERVLSEPSPSDLAYWTVRDRPRARQLLDTIRDGTR
jgi:tetratricopeptide (TPR) repeat protein